MIVDRMRAPSPSSCIERPVIAGRYRFDRPCHEMAPCVYHLPTSAAYEVRKISAALKSASISCNCHPLVRYSVSRWRSQVRGLALETRVTMGNSTVVKFSGCCGKLGSPKFRLLNDFRQISDPQYCLESTLCIAPYRY